MRLVDGLADPARRRRAALVFVLGYGALWFVYGVIAKSSQDLNADMAEMVVWTREPALGYPKHPPLLAWILWGWFKIFPLADWAYILLAVVDRRGRHLSGDRARRRMARRAKSSPRCRSCSPSIPFYNFLGLKFDQNSILIPLWALAMWAMLRALDTRHVGWAALAGLAAAAAMLSKYWSVFLLAALALDGAVSSASARDYFRSRRAVGDGAGVFLVAVAPHVWWLIRENFPADHLGDVAARLVLVRRTAAIAGRMRSAAPPAMRRSRLRWCSSSCGRLRAALADGFFPRDERRDAAILFWVPLLLPVVPALIKNINLLSLWNTPALNLLPVMLLGSPLVVRAARRGAAHRRRRRPRSRC